MDDNTNSAGLSCAVCGGTAWIGVELDETLRVGGQEYRYTVPAQRCGACGDVLIAGEVSEAMSRLEILAVAMGPASGEGFRRLRRWLGLKATEAASLLRTTNVTVSRWETGVHPMDDSAFIVLALAVLADLGDPRPPLEIMRARRAEAGPPLELGRVEG